MEDERPQKSGLNHRTGGHSSIDELDRRLVRLLVADGRASYRSLAAALGVSTTTVASRVSELERARVIRGYSPRLDFEKLGFAITAVTSILVSKGRLLEMEREIAKLPEVCAVYDVTGEIDAVIVSKFRTREELSHFTKRLLSMPFVDRANTHVVLTAVKEDFRPPV